MTFMVVYLIAGFYSLEQLLLALDAVLLMYYHHMWY